MAEDNAQSAASLQACRDTDSLEAGWNRAEAYHQTGQWQATVQVCEWLVQTWSSGSALYLLVLTQTYLGSRNAALLLIDKYQEPVQTASPSNSQMSVLIAAEKQYISHNLVSAISLYEEALQSPLDSIYLDSCATYRLGQVYHVV